MQKARPKPSLSVTATGLGSPATEASPRTGLKCRFPGDTRNMGVHVQKVKSQTKPRPNALFNFVQSFRVKHSNIIDPLPLLLPGIQQAQSVKADCQNDVALHPHFRLIVRRGQWRIERQFNMMRLNAGGRRRAERHDCAEALSPTDRWRKYDCRTSLDHFRGAEALRQIDPQNGSRKRVSRKGHVQLLIVHNPCSI
jgi:hypothetical protein